MKDYIEERAVEIACYIIENKGTVRQAAKKFGISKSTVHADVTIQNDTKEYNALDWFVELKNMRIVL